MTPKRRQVHWNKPLRVLRVTNFRDSSSSSSCWCTADKSSLVNFVPPVKQANKSPGFGSGY